MARASAWAVLEQTLKTWVYSKPDLEVSWDSVFFFERGRPNRDEN